TLELVNEADKFKRANQKLVPNFLDGDLDAACLGVGDEFSDIVLGPSVSVAVADLLADDRWYDEDGVAAVGLTVEKLLADRFHPAANALRMRVGERATPGARTAAPVDKQPGFAPRAESLAQVELTGTDHLDPVEARFFQALKTRSRVPFPEPA